MNYYVCLRDDDTSFFTKPEELLIGYEDIFGQLPITLATVPFMQGSSRVMSNLDPVFSIKKGIRTTESAKKNQYDNMRIWEEKASVEEAGDYYRVHPLSDNPQIVEFLKPYIADEKIEIAQHGVYHQYTPTGPEMRSGRISFETVRFGKEYLEKVFNLKIKTFIPPSNTIDAVCAEYVHKLQMNLFCSGGIRYSSIGEKALSCLSDYKTMVFNIRKKMRKDKVPMFISNGLAVFGSFTFDPFKDMNAVMSALNSQLEETGFASLGTHYYLLENDEYREQFLKIVHQLMEKEGVRFVTASKYCELMKEKYNE